MKTLYVKNMGLWAVDHVVVDGSQSYIATPDPAFPFLYFYGIADGIAVGGMTKADWSESKGVIQVLPDQWGAVQYDNVSLPGSIGVFGFID